MPLHSYICGYSGWNTLTSNLNFHLHFQISLTLRFHAHSPPVQLFSTIHTHTCTYLYEIVFCLLYYMLFCRRIQLVDLSNNDCNLLLSLLPFLHSLFCKNIMPLHSYICGYSGWNTLTSNLNFHLHFQILLTLRFHAHSPPVQLFSTIHTHTCTYLHEIVFCLLYYMLFCRRIQLVDLSNNDCNLLLSLLPFLHSLFCKNIMPLHSYICGYSGW